jgi:cobalt-zinc-cadmium efflux system protein
MASDALVSFGVVISALVISRTGWLWLDPVVSLGIVLLITLGTWGLFRESLDLSLDAVPRHVDSEAVETYLRQVDGVASVHDLHIWPLSTNMVGLTAHLIKPDGPADDHLLAVIVEHLRSKFGIDHATLQFERGQTMCHLTDAHSGAH